MSTPLDRPVLATVDSIALVAFAAIGKSSHAPDGSVDFGATLAVAAPFLVSWWVTSPWTNVYGPKATPKLSEVILQTAQGWIVAVPLGIVLRGIVKGYVPPTPFVIVTMASTLIILGLARVAYALVEQKLSEESNTNV
jgi:Protein of unknown function (DUF3054)